MKIRLGIIGNPVSGSFSPSYFANKFTRLGYSDARYDAHLLTSIAEFESLIVSHPHLLGLNVTHPFKEAILPYLNELSPEAQQIGAVNTVLFHNSIRTGFNTDVMGIRQTFKSLGLGNSGVLVLGTGGASKAVQFVCDQQHIPFKVVSRSPMSMEFSYTDIKKELLSSYPVIVNCTPLGMTAHPGKPPIPYRYLNSSHILIDLIYQPHVTPFLYEGLNRGCRVKNGFEMLVTQAEASWNIWKSALELE